MLANLKVVSANPHSAIALQKLSVFWYFLLLKHQEGGLRSMEGEIEGKGIRSATKQFAVWIDQDLDLNL